MILAADLKRSTMSRHKITLPQSFNERYKLPTYVLSRPQTKSVEADLSQYSSFLTCSSTALPAQAKHLPSSPSPNPSSARPSTAPASSNSTPLMNAASTLCAKRSKTLRAPSSRNLPVWTPPTAKNTPAHHSKSSFSMRRIV